MQLSLRIPTLFLLAAAACSFGKPPLDLATPFAEDQGKSDAAKSTKLLDSVGPEVQVEAKFDRRIRVYGYVIEAKAGALLDISLTAEPGADAVRVDPSAPLDTVVHLYGPFNSVTDAGELLFEEDDGATTAAPPIKFPVQADGRYLLAVSSWEDTGSGKFTVKSECTGTDFQCKRPAFDKPCKDGSLFLQGALIDASTTWDVCEVVLLEPTSVAPGATLTVRPGVVVKANFLGTGNFGTVGLDVQGRLQAVGTKKDPIAFTSFVADKGWSGITLRTGSSTLGNVFIERAFTPVQMIASDSPSTIRDAVIEGFPAIHQGTAVTVQGKGAVIERSLIIGFARAVSANGASTITIDDSVIRDNTEAVVVVGTNGGQFCSSATPTPEPRKLTVRRTDIIKNAGRAIDLTGSDYSLTIERANLVGNASLALELKGFLIAAGSTIRDSNIFDNSNGGALQIRSNTSNTLDAAKNFWEFTADPQLSASFQNSCGTGLISFSGFLPSQVIFAGPDESKLIDEVKRQTLHNTN